MTAPRVIVIPGCFSCPHSHDWSSGGLVCRYRDRDRTIVEGYGPRAPFCDSTPDWCPLPKATAIEYPSSS